MKRTAGHRTDQADAPGEFRQWFFAVGVEQAFTLELLAQLVDLLFEPACADFADIVADEAQSGLLDPDVGASVDDHAVALAELRGRRGEGAPAGYGDGDVFEIVSYREVGGSCASGVDFGDLAADPCRRPFLHGGVEFLAQHAYRPGVFRSGFACQSWQLVERTGYRCAGHVRVLVHGNHYRCGVESSCDLLAAIGGVDCLFGVYRVSRSAALRRGRSGGCRGWIVTLITQSSFWRYYAEKH